MSRPRLGESMSSRRRCRAHSSAVLSAPPETATTTVSSRQRCGGQSAATRRSNSSQSRGGREMGGELQSEFTLVTYPDSMGAAIVAARRVCWFFECPIDVFVAACGGGPVAG